MGATRLIGSALLALALLGCATLPTKPADRAQSMDFARGCWVEKDAPSGPARAFLRLLPDPADPLVLRGDIVSVRQGWKPLASMAFARDMSWASFEYRFAGSRPKVYGPSRHEVRVGTATPKAPVYAAFGKTPGSRDRLILKVDPDGDRIGVTMDFYGTGSGVFNGERDGCD